MRRFKGFTLTELMVALAVIGILVAVVTPAIMKTRPNKNKMMVKKSFYTVEQVVSSLINDEQLYPDMREACETATDNGSNIYCAWGFDYTYDAKLDGSVYKGNYKFASLFKERLNVSKNLGTAEASAGPDSSSFYPVFITTDGIKWDFTGTKNAWKRGSTAINQYRVGTFDDQTNAAGIDTILIDVNGEEAPNCRQSAEGCSAEDFDQYQIQVLASGKLKINDSDAKAIEYATINTSIRDSL